MLKSIVYLLGLIILACLINLLAPLSSFSTRCQVSPWVLQATSDGQHTDFIVVLAKQADLKAAYNLPDKSSRSRFVYQTLTQTAQSQAPLRAWLDDRHVPYRSFYIVNLIHILDGDRALLQTLAARPDVARIIANPQIQNLQPAPTSPAVQSVQAIEWNIRRVNADDVWMLGYTGQGIVVGAQDTGYDWDHPALINQYRGWDGANASHDYNWHDAIATSLYPIDPHSHGTHTMGTILGDDGADNQIGMAPGAQWIGCRNMSSSGVGTPATYLECFEFFLAPYPLGGIPAQGVPDLAPDVTNNSWSCPSSEGCDWDTLQAAVQAQHAAGILTVVSAGNSGSPCQTVSTPPAIYDAAYTVGATTSNDTIASYSSRGPVTIDGSGRLKPDISAPGSSVRSSMPGTGYGSKNGTSMAGPHVAGAAALLWSARPDLRGQITDTETLLNTTALPRYSSQCGDLIDARPNNVYGWGRLDALAAIHTALRGYLSGSIHDVEGAPIAGVQVEAALNPSVVFTTTSDTGGSYDLELISGAFSVTTAISGHSPYTANDVIVIRGNTTTLAITLCQHAQNLGINYAPAQPGVAETTTFTAAVVSGNAPISYTWRLSDGAMGSGPVFTHSFAAQGVYTVTATASNCAGAAQISATQNVWVGLSPVIHVTPTLLSATLGTNSSSNQTFVIANDGAGVLEWWLAETPPTTWLSTTPMSGTLPPVQGEALSVTVAFDSAGLESETYTTSLQINSNDTQQPQIWLPVTLTVLCTPITGVELTQATTGSLALGDVVVLSADISPDNFGAPYTYTLDYGDGSAPVGESSSDDPLALQHVFNSTGVFTVEIWAWNCSKSAAVAASDSLQVSIKAVEPAHHIYLPVIIKNG